MESHECVTPESAVCKVCGVDKKLDDYYFDKKKNYRFSTCKECCKKKDNANYLKNRDNKLVKQAQRRSEKKDEIRQWMADYYLKNREEVLSRCNEYRKREGVKERESERQKMYYAARSAEIQAKRKLVLMSDPEKQEARREYGKKHLQQNKAMYAAKRGKRRAAEFRATPSWANQDAIKRIYLLAEKISTETGIKHHVDHVYPLQGKKVCGLHFENNLQIIPATENLKKFNKLIEG